MMVWAYLQQEPMSSFILGAPEYAGGSGPRKTTRNGSDAIGYVNWPLLLDLVG